MRDKKERKIKNMDEKRQKKSEYTIQKVEVEVRLNAVKNKKETSKQEEKGNMRDKEERRVKR